MYTKITYGCLVHALVYDLSFKKMGSSKDPFLDFRVLLPGSQKYFREYLCENENILGYCSRAQVLSIYAKNQSSKI